MLGTSLGMKRSIRLKLKLAQVDFILLPKSDDVVQGGAEGRKPGAGFNGRVNGFTRVDSVRPVADQ